MTRITSTTTTKTTPLSLSSFYIIKQEIQREMQDFLRTNNDYILKRVLLKQYIVSSYAYKTYTSSESTEVILSLLLKNGFVQDNFRIDYS